MASDSSQFINKDPYGFPYSERAAEHCRREIGAGLRALGIREGDTLLMHTSIKSFGNIEGGVNNLINALILAVGESGNLMVPALTGSAELSKDNPPVFDAQKTPCWTGLFPETFRKRREAVRSLHPTHSVSVIGAGAEEIIKDHELCETPCGKGSPYYKLAGRKGKVVCFGVDFERVTLFHTVEELAGVPYHLQPEMVEATVIDTIGNTKKVNLYLHKYGDERCFSRMEPILAEFGGIKKDKVLRSPTMVIDAEKLVNVTLEKLKSDPLFLLER